MLDSQPSTVDLNVSLEPHISDALRPLQAHLPSELQSLLQPLLIQPSPPTIPYNILLKVSQWTRTSPGRQALQQVERHPSDYAMIALLAGTKTSPDKKFPPYTPPKEPHVLAMERKNDRRAITAIINGFLSVIGTGMAAWWASDKTGYRDEWRVLLSFSAAIVVAVSEITLYIIWQSRTTSSKTFTGRSAGDKKEQVEPGDNTSIAVLGVSNAIEDRAVELRERNTRTS